MAAAAGSSSSRCCFYGYTVLVSAIVLEASTAAAHTGGFSIFVSHIMRTLSMSRTTLSAGRIRMWGQKMSSKGTKKAESGRGVWFWLNRHGICTPHFQ